MGALSDRLLDGTTRSFVSRVDRTNASLFTQTSRIEGCSSGSECVDGLPGTPVPGCGGAARHGIARVMLKNGSSLGVAAYHATSGSDPEDITCRVRQQKQIKRDLADASVEGELGWLVLGDFNTDPVRDARKDESARHLQSWIASTEFSFLTDVGASVPETYPGRGNIDHVIGAGIEGACISPGVDGQPSLLDAVYFDHVPIECRVWFRESLKTALPPSRQ